MHAICVLSKISPKLGTVKLHVLHQRFPDGKRKIVSDPHSLLPLLFLNVQYNNGYWSESQTFP